MWLNVSLLNVHSIRSASRRAAVFKLLAASPYDILCLQDCNISEEPTNAKWDIGLPVWSLCGEKIGGGYSFQYILIY